MVAAAGGIGREGDEERGNRAVFVAGFHAAAGGIMGEDDARALAIDGEEHAVIMVRRRDERRDEGGKPAEAEQVRGKAGRACDAHPPCVGLPEPPHVFSARA
ncbi:MAG: hypothetical protein RL153_811 [Verrucomicrobiota bacterium]